MTLHLNKKHVLFQIESPQEVLKTYFLVTTKEKSKAELEQIFLERTQRHFAKLVFSFRWDRPIFFGRFVRKSSKQLQTIQNDEDHVSEKIKSCFFPSIPYRKTSQTQDVKSQSTEHSVRKIPQPKRDSAFEQRTRIVSCREISGISQKSFFIYNQRKKQSRAQTDIFGTYSTSFWKVGLLLSVRSPNIFRTVCTKIIKTIAHNPKRRRPRFRKNQKLFFSKYTVSQDISNAGCKEPKYQT